MSRRFARQMDRNKKQLNETQRKSGKQGNLKASNETKFIGRSLLLPSFLIGMLIWYLILFIGDKGFDKEYGARPLNRAIQKYLEDALAESILSELKDKIPSQSFERSITSSVV
jgi:hypothetical protein